MAITSKKWGSILARGGNRLLRPLGWQLRPAEPPLDLRNQTDNPIHGLYLAAGRPFVVDVAMHNVRGLLNLAFPCKPGAGDPYVETAAAYLRGECSAYRDSPLEAFYSAWKPSSAATAMGLDAHDASPSLRSLKPHFIVLPWGSLSPEQEVRRSAAVAAQENARNGRPDLGIAHGSLVFGLTSEKGQLEFERLRRIADSMALRGYVRSDAPGGDIEGYLLIDGTRWAVAVRRGIHRTAVAVALGLKRIAVRFGSYNPSWSGPAIRGCEAEFWPNVRNGLFTVHHGRTVFLRMLEGRQPTGCPRLSDTRNRLAGIEMT